MSRDKNKNGKNLKRIILIIIIIIILLLITSCNSNFFGKIGDFFDNSSSYKINDDNNTLEEEKNTLLKFIKSNGETSVDDIYKIEFISNLNVKKYGCMVSDSKIATCRVKDNYVVVYPKKKGKVKISVIAKSNGKKYIGTHNLKITASSKSIKLSSTFGTINLSKRDSISVYYKLNNINGNVIVTSSNERVAKASAKNGILTIKAYKPGKAIITLKVTEGKKEYTATYELTVYKDKTIKNKQKPSIIISDNKKINNADISSLDNVKVLGFQTIKVNSNNYKATVNYDTSNISLNIVKTSPSSTVKYMISNQNGQNVLITDISNIDLTEGDNIITMVVTSESKKNSTTYTLVIHKPIRTIEIIKLDEILIENPVTDIIYEIKDNDKLVKDYSINEISASINNNFNGKIEIKKGKISIIPSALDVYKNFELTLEYLGKTSTMSFTVNTKDYYASFNDNTYDLVYEEDGSNQYIIVNTNIFNDDREISKTLIEGGIRLSNSIGYIDIISSNENILSILYEENIDASNSLALLTKIKSEGNVTITVKGEAYGKLLKTVYADVNITSKYKIIIDANKGFFNSFTSKYELLLNKGDIVKLSDYVAYLVDDEEECTYFELDSYNTSSLGDGIKYNLSEEITVNKSLKLYAIYKKTSKPIDIEETGVMYLTDVDLFHNEEYYKKYNKDKIIYPNANGSHTMYIENNTLNTISIDSITLTEDTVCIEKGCINMGYILRYYLKDDESKDTNYHYFYGSNDSYKVLNQDINVIKNNYDGLYSNTIRAEHDKSSPIILDPKGKNSVEIDLLWKWVDLNDEVDTEIGKLENNKDYTITVKIEYSKVNSCKK